MDVYGELLDAALRMADYLMDVIQKELADEQGLVYRYRREDGPEGTFLLCGF